MNPALRIHSHAAQHESARPDKSGPTKNMAAALIAIDWGTSSARAYRLDARGRILDEQSAPLGVQKVEPGEFPQALTALLGADVPECVPMIACGMIGSRQGWIEAPYRDCPADFDGFAAALTPVPGTRLCIVPGLVCRDADGVPDVMRGEETQILGALDDQTWAQASPRVVVARARFDPALAGGRLFLLPERSARLQVIHNEFARGERLAAVRPGHDDQHDLIGGLQLADAMDHERIVDAPSRLGLVYDPRERLLGHDRIMFDRERGYGRCVVDVADETDKRGDRAYARVAGA